MVSCAAKERTMENKSPTPTPTPTPTLSSSSLRWGILRDAFLARTPSSQSDNQSQIGLKRISRKTALGFNLLPCRFINKHIAEENLDSLLETNNRDFATDDVYVSYTLPLDRAPTLVLRQRVENHVNLSDFEICNRYNIDNTGLVCNWPSEDVLAYFCLSHADMFRSKRILELGAGYGLAGLVIAATTDASEVVISDGNPQVVDYIQHNIHGNSGAFTDTEVKSMILHWNQEQDSNFSNSFDIIVASDCTFFKEFHVDLAQTIKSMLKPSEDSQAIFFSPKRGNSLDIFLEKIKEVGLHFNVSENYDKEVWLRHEKFLNGDKSWPNYEKDHCYPFLIRITL